MSVQAPHPTSTALSFAPLTSLLPSWLSWGTMFLWASDPQHCHVLFFTEQVPQAAPPARHLVVPTAPTVCRFPACPGWGSSLLSIPPLLTPPLHNNISAYTFPSPKRSVTQAGVRTCPHWVCLWTWDQGWQCTSLFSLNCLNEGLSTKNINLCLKVWNTSKIILSCHTLLTYIFILSLQKFHKQNNKYISKVKSYANVLSPYKLAILHMTVSIWSHTTNDYMSLW